MKAARRSALGRALAMAGLVAGATAPAGAASSADAQTLGTVTVQGVSYGTDAVALPSTVSTLDQRDLTQGQPQVNLSETLSAVPGLVVNNRQDYAQDMQLSIRGFGADSAFGVQDVYMTLDGVPLTMPDGQGQAQVIDLPTIGGIEVIKGPFAALYGNAAGGVIQAWTRDAPQSGEASLRTWFGPWGTSQTTLVGGGTSGAWSGVAGLTDFRTDGWRDHSDATRRQFNGTLQYDAGGDDRYGVVLNALNQDALDPGGLTKAELQQDPRQVDPAMTQFNTRKTVRNRQVGVTWDHRFDPDDTLHVDVYDGTRRVVQYLPFTGSSGTSAGGVVDLHDAFGGVGAMLTHAGTLAARPYTVAAGVDYGREDEWRKGWVNQYGAEGGLRNDQYNTVDNLSQYVQAHWDLTPAVSLSGGVRHDEVRFDSANAQDALFGAGTGGGASYGSTDPVVGLMWRIDAHNRVYADYGHGFVTPTFYQLAYRPDGQPGLNFGLQPMHMRNTEVGWRGRWGGLQLDASAYSIDTDNQIVVYASTGGRTTYVNAGSTRRQGADLSVRADLPGHVSAQLAYGLIDVHFTGGPYNGRVMPGVPRQQLDASLTWRPPLATPALQGFYARADWLARSQVWVDAPNSAAAPGYGALNLSTGIEQHHGRWTLSEFLRVDNVLDRNYVAAVVIADSNGRFYEAAPGRNAMAGIEVSRKF